MKRSLGRLILLFVLLPNYAFATTNFESSKLTSGVVVQNKGMESSKLSAGVVTSNTGLESSKLSVGIVVMTRPPVGGAVQRAPLTHW